MLPTKNFLQKVIFIFEFLWKVDNDLHMRKSLIFPTSFSIFV